MKQAGLCTLDLQMLERYNGRFPVSLGDVVSRRYRNEKGDWNKMQEQDAQLYTEAFRSWLVSACDVSKSPGRINRFWFGSDSSEIPFREIEEICSTISQSDFSTLRHSLHFDRLVLNPDSLKVEFVLANDYDPELLYIQTLICERP